MLSTIYKKKNLYYVLFVVTALPHAKTFQFIFPDIKVYSVVLLLNAAFLIKLAFNLYKSSSQRMPTITTLLLLIQAYMFFYELYAGVFYVDLLLILQNMLTTIIIGYSVWMRDSLDKLFHSIIIVNLTALLFSFVDFDIASKMFFYLGGDVGIYASGYNYRFTGIFGPPGIATVYFCSIFIFYFYRGVTEKRFYVIYIFCAFVSLSFGLLSFSRAFLLGVTIFSAFILVIGLKYILTNRSKIIISGIFVAVIIVMFGGYIDEIIEIYKRRIEQGVDNRVYGENGVFDLINSIDLQTIFYGGLHSIDKAQYVIINRKYFRVDNGFLYILSAFGVWAAIPVFFLYYSAIRTLIIKILNPYGYMAEKKNLILHLLIIACMLLNSFSEATLLTPINLVLITLALKDGVWARKTSILQPRQIRAKNYG